MSKEEISLIDIIKGLENMINDLNLNIEIWLEEYQFKVKELENMINNLTLNLEMWLDEYHFDEEHKIKQRELISKASTLIGKPKTIEELREILKKEEDLEILKKEEDLIIKEALVGFVVIKYMLEDGSISISVDPLNISWDGVDDNENISDKGKVIGVISAPPNSYRVLGLFPNDVYEFLGYEFTGAYNPDWKEELKYRIKVEENVNIKE